MNKILIVAVLFLAFAIAPTASACSPSYANQWPPSMSKSYKDSGAVFVGTVKSVEQIGGMHGDTFITFNVDVAYKGKLPKTVTVRVPSSGSSCGYNNATQVFAPGKVWAMFVGGTSASNFRTSHLVPNTSFVSVSAAKATLASHGIYPLNDKAACTKSSPNPGGACRSQSLIRADQQTQPQVDAKQTLPSRPRTLK